jgi:hypothetical protein
MGSAGMLGAAMIGLENATGISALFGSVLEPAFLRCRRL